MSPKPKSALAPSAEDSVEASATGSRLDPAPAMFRGSPERKFYAGSNLERARTIEDLRAMAHRRLPPFAIEYLEGGAEEEATLARNRAALASYRLLARALVDVRHRDQSVTLFDRRMPLPFAIAPTGLNGLFWHKADLLLAEAAAEAGIPFIQSTMSNDPMEEVARVPGLRHWWQLYVFGSAEVRNALIARAERAGCEALVVTIDTQFYGNREWEERRLTPSNRPTLASMLETIMYPGWIATTLQRGLPSFANIVEFVPAEHRNFFASAFWIRGHMDYALDWNEMSRIRSLWPRKLLIKGLLNVDDIQRAAAIGVDGVILSNHGGRQLDWTISGLDALPEARKRVGDKLTLIVDGGMRRGTDILKGMALGANAVLLGRAMLFGLAAAGRKGVDRAVEILRDEIDRDMGLLGLPSLSAVGPGFLTR